jgi:CubicO group peptidase (beta-lactamase class C family)
MKHAFLLITLCFSLSSGIAQSTYSKEVQEQIKQFENNLNGRIKIEGESSKIADRMAFYKVKGLSVAVVKDYKVLWAKGYGWADEKQKIPVTDKTLFMAGSISKSINGMGMLKLSQDGRIDLTADINTYLSSWKFPYDSVSHGKKISSLNLMSHTAGLNRGGPHYFPGDTLPTLIQILNGDRIAKDREPVRSIKEPGLVSEYSNNGVSIMELIINDISQQPFEQYISENIFKPIGMTSSFYAQDSIKKRQKLLATGYGFYGTETPGKHPIIPMLAAGGLWTTPTDLGKFIAELQLEYANKSSAVLRAETAKQMLTPYKDNSAALGVFINERPDGSKYFQHGGAVPGFRSQYFGSLEGGDGVVVMVNSENPRGLVDDVVNTISRIYQWKGSSEVITKKEVKLSDSIMKKYLGVYTAMPNTFTHIVKKEDGYFQYSDGNYNRMYFISDTVFFIKEADNEKHFIKDANGKITGYYRFREGKALPKHVRILSPDTLNWEDRILGDVGWNCLENGHFDGAISYFKRQLVLYPNSLFPQGNLAHCYLLKNEYNKAITQYKAYLDVTVGPDLTMKQMILNDFVSFKESGLVDEGIMKKVMADLKLEVPVEFKRN